MLMRRVTAKEKVNNGVMRAAWWRVWPREWWRPHWVAHTTDATCIGISGISINDGTG